MDKRLLYGCIAALATMLGFDLLTQLSGLKLDLPMRTPLGTVFIGGAVVTFAAMALGGWIARRNFRWIALALGVAVWIAVVGVLYSVALPANPAISLAAMLKFSAPAIVLSLLASWLGAVFGERLVARRGMPASA